jgi:hypothetical protein
LVKLGLTTGQKVGFWTTEKGYKLGPYFGIMTNKRSDSAQGFRGLRGRRENYTALLRLAHSMGAVAFVFACEDVDFKKMRVLGYRQQSDGRWYSQSYPIPDVVYNRVPDRKSELSAVVVATKRRIAQLERTHGVHLFNPHFLNKWELHKLFSRDPRVKPHLPSTRLYRSTDDIVSGLKQHGFVYLKPRDSFAGRGIMRASRSRDGYTLSVKRGTRYHHIRSSEVSGLLSLFQRHRRPGVYLVQQGLELARYKGSIFDARIIVQKNGQGQWVLSGAGVRVAARGGITTHVPNGGYIAPIEKVLGTAFAEHSVGPDVVYERIRQLALTIAPSIEEHYKKLFGELSMDIGIDRNGNCYFFEANAKPMKFDEPTIRKETLRCLIEYARYLAGYRMGGYKYADHQG